MLNKKLATVFYKNINSVKAIKARKSCLEFYSICLCFRLNKTKQNACGILIDSK